MPRFKDPQKGQVSLSLERPTYKTADEIIAQALKASWPGKVTASATRWLPTQLQIQSASPAH